MKGALENREIRSLLMISASDSKEQWWVFIRNFDNAAPQRLHPDGILIP
jgi:hypothetical protein